MSLCTVGFSATLQRIEPQRTIEDALKLMKTARGYRPSWVLSCSANFDGTLFTFGSAYDFNSLATLLQILDSLQPSKTVTVTLSREDAERHARLPFIEAHNVRVLNAIEKALEQ